MKRADNQQAQTKFIGKTNLENSLHMSLQMKCWLNADSVSTEITAVKSPNLLMLSNMISSGQCRVIAARCWLITLQYTKDMAVVFKLCSVCYEGPKIWQENISITTCSMNCSYKAGWMLWVCVNCSPSFHSQCGLLLLGCSPSGVAHSLLWRKTPIDQQCRGAKNQFAQVYYEWKKLHLEYELFT